MSRDLDAEEAALRRQLETPERWKAVYALQALEIERARRLLGLRGSGRLAASARRLCKAGFDPQACAEAAGRLAIAEQWQWEIGSWATGAGEGLASMAQVRELQMAQAWLLIAASESTGGARVHELVTEVEADPNGQGAPYREMISEIRTMLGSPPGARKR